MGRVGITVRFNYREQKVVNALSEFWKLQPKDLIRFAVDQLAQVTATIEKKIEAERPQENKSQGETKPEEASSEQPV